ncbi:MAG: hypothetical protein K6T75_06345 [Acetobacteraceae bacterium]|nr:hypothetical protein [Acetobacteraceae bacterium]
MGPRGWHRGRLAALGAAGLCVLALSGWLCLGGSLGQYLQGQQPPPGVPGRGAGLPPPEGAPPPGPRVEPGGRVVLSTLYRSCGHREEVSGMAPPGLVGRGVEALTQAFPGWSVEMRPGVVVLSRVADGFCGEDLRFRHLGVAGGKVAVFYGLPRPDPVLKELTGVEVSRLTVQDRRRLEEGGVVAAGDEAIEAWLEGLGE